MLSSLPCTSSGLADSVAVFFLLIDLFQAGLLAAVGNVGNVIMESPSNGDGDGGPARYSFVLLDASLTSVFSRLERARQMGALRVTGPHDDFMIWIVLLVAVSSCPLGSRRVTGVEKWARPRL